MPHVISLSSPRRALAALTLALLGLPACGGANVEAPEPTHVEFANPDRRESPRAPAELSVAPPPDVAAPPADALRTESGLASRILRPGVGDERPSNADVVIVRYTGWTTDGRVFDSTLPTGVVRAFPLSAVFPGWAEGLRLMQSGERRRLWIPEALAYRGRRAPFGMLVYDVELVGIESTAPSVPADVAGAPPSADRTPSGLAFVVLREGVGAAHPTASSRVQVHYSVWQPDGTLIDSSLNRMVPASMELAATMPGWTEGVPLMVAGEKRRFWIPAHLAFASHPELPQGPFVVDITLLGFEG